MWSLLPKSGQFFVAIEIKYSNIIGRVGSFLEYSVGCNESIIFLTVMTLFRGGTRISSYWGGGGGGHLKKLRRAEEGANILGVFRVKNHYFTPKNHSFYNYGGRREKVWGISCEKSRFYAKKTYFFPILGGARAGCTPPPPGSAPAFDTQPIKNRNVLLYN